MQAITLKRAGSADLLVPSEVPKPVPSPTDLLIRIHAASVTRGDVVMRKMPKLIARLFGETPKSVPGYEYAGIVEELGSEATRFSVGDRVFGTTSGLAQGSYAEYITVPADGLLATIPDSLGFEDAAPVPVGAMAALDFLRAGGVRQGSRVLINGASGSVGTFAVQIAKYLGAYVTAVAGPANADLVISLGADTVIDYTKEDFTESGLTFDVVFDTVGNTTRRNVGGILANDGEFITTKGRRKEARDDLLAVRDLLASGAITPIIDRIYPLEEAAEAHRYVEQGHKRGNVVLLVSTNSESESVQSGSGG